MRRVDNWTDPLSDARCSAGNWVWGEADLFKSRLSPNSLIAKVACSAAKNPLSSRWKCACRLLLLRLQRIAEPAYLLPECLLFFRLYNEIVEPRAPFGMAHFELWLNGCAQLSDADQGKIRGKISGRRLPQTAYQTLFPVGSRLTGSHLISAHTCPDLDTSIASFWHWVDAFAARTSTSLHVWNLPGGALAPQDQIAFWRSTACMPSAARTAKRLSLCALELAEAGDLIEIGGHRDVRLLRKLDSEALIAVTGMGGIYLGAWRDGDRGRVGAFARFIERCLIVAMRALWQRLAKRARQGPLIDSLLNEPLQDYVRPTSFCGRDRKNCARLWRLLPLASKWRTPLRQFLQSHLETAVCPESERQVLSSLSAGDSRDWRRFLRIARRACHNLALYLRIRERVLRDPSTHALSSDTVKQVRQKLGDQSAIMVVHPTGGGLVEALGIARAERLRRFPLGHVSLCDVSDGGDVVMESHLSLISCFDHHRPNLQTREVATIEIADVQSCNTLMGERALAIGKKFGTEGQSHRAVDGQIEILMRNPHQLACPAKRGEFARALRLKGALNCCKGEWFVHPGREFAQLRSYLVAILDDTDLLSRVSARDVLCAVRLFNRLQSLARPDCAEAICCEDLTGDVDEIAMLTRRLVDQPALQVLMREYCKVRAECIDRAMRISAGKKRVCSALSWFADTKRDRHFRVGQSKMLIDNIALFSELRSALLEQWLIAAQRASQRNGALRVHLHMCSTVRAEEGAGGKLSREFSHRDQLWFWIPPTRASRNQLIDFLRGFRKAPALRGQDLELELVSGDSNRDWQGLFEENFSPCGRASVKELTLCQSMAILHLRAGSLNSRKESITPYLGE